MEADNMSGLYEGSSEAIWQHKFDARTDWKLADKFIRTRLSRGSRILDVGCWDGTFLEHYSKQCEIYGIELNSEAALKAQRRGIYVVGNDFRVLKEHSALYDIITAFDIIEHLHNPKEFIELLLSCVKKDGYIIFSSGDADSYLWSILKHKYWYCAFAEHVSFVNTTWVKNTMKSMNCEIVAMVTFSHRTRRLFQALLEAVAVLSYLSSAAIYRSIRTIIRGEYNKYAVPQMSIARDHMLVVLKRS